MKKKLEADLMSIAHRVLQMKNKSDVNQLCIEARKLYEKLTILQFVEEHFESSKPTIGKGEVAAKMEQLYEDNDVIEVKPEIVNENPVEQEVVSDEFVGQVIEKDDFTEEDNTPEVEAEYIQTEPDEVVEEIIADEPAKEAEFDFLPAFELDIESEKEAEAPKKVESIQISFEELLGTDYTQTHFVRVEQNKKKENSLDFELPKESSILEEIEVPIAQVQTSSSTVEAKNSATIEKAATGINIGLNDRIAFVKHLFANSDEDYNRVMNQLITFDNFVEVQNFIEDMVKPDYDDWQGKEDYEQRFIDIIEKKFA